MMTDENSNSFNDCDFLMGKNNNSIVIVVPVQLPKQDELTVRLKGKNILFCSGDQNIAEVTCHNPDVLKRLSEHDQVGMIEFEDNMPQFPAYITAVANIDKQENLQET